ncbi:hypothetical protein CRG98_030818 [Punica granatum]|uniref:Uncharacterized protein n=1 Tax=Punica granatum TaxID=22663 RepID=A0A2I0IZD7_PUNGR|nr:hypothetical protein CRG98_030818 [Punica granatum]
MEKLLQKKDQLAKVQLCTLEVACTSKVQPSSGEDHQKAIEFAPYLKEFEDIFREPKGLPPKRPQDHRIPLKEGAQPVNIRPYRSIPSFWVKDVLSGEQCTYSRTLPRTCAHSRTPRAPARLTSSHAPILARTCILCTRAPSKRSTESPDSRTLPRLFPRIPRLGKSLLT